MFRLVYARQQRICQSFCTPIRFKILANSACTLHAFQSNGGNVTTSQIVVSFLAWFIVTGLVIAIARRYRTERSSLYAGMAFLMATLIGVLTIYVVFEQALQCQKPVCWADKARVDTLLQFILITWGALGGSLLAKVVENRSP